ncbi:MAG: electron transport complex subunit RsxC [Alphaproteobacteria bacterium]
MVKTFAVGGIHPHDNKLSNKVEIYPVPIPKVVYVPLSQHLGAPAKAIVNKGDEVKVGTLIAESSSFISANIHSPVSGKVSKVDKVLGSSGYLEDMIVINVEGDVWEDEIDRSKDLISDIKMSSKDIISKIKEKGIVGMGGAGFPTHVKISVPDGKKAEYLLINGVECEPYLTSDHRLMLEKSEEIMVGIKILMKALNVDTAVIGIEANKPDAIAKLRDVSKKYDGIKIQPLKVKYPQGGEKQLIAAALKREVPSKGLPIDVGVIVQNVGTVFAVYEAVQKNKPLIERIVTVSGKCLKEPSNFLSRIGVPFGILIDMAGGVPENTAKLINGGPMMGKTMVSDEIPVTKTCSGLLLISEKDAVRDEETPCIRCGRCSEACPAGLEPFMIASVSKIGDWERQRENHVFDCIECGSCTHVCPAKIPLLDYCRLAKAELRKIDAKKRS